MTKLLISFKTMVTLITQARAALKATEKIRAHRIEFQQLIQLDGYYAHFRSDWLVNSLLRNQILLTSCSALEEFTIQACPEFADRIKLFRRQIRPVTKRIDKCEGFKEISQSDDCPQSAH